MTDRSVTCGAFVKRARSVEDKGGRRAELLTVALDEFFKRGFSASRMDDIAANARLSKGTLYLYFASKEALFKALIDSLAMPNLTEIEAIAERASSVFDALQGLAAYAPTMIRHSNLPKLMKVLIGDSHNFPDIVSEYRTLVLDRILAALTQLLSKAEARGEIETDDPGMLARLLIAPIAFSGIWQAVFGSDPHAEVDLEALFQMHIKMMIKALTPLGEQRDAQLRLATESTE